MRTAEFPPAHTSDPEGAAAALARLGRGVGETIIRIGSHALRPKPAHQAMAALDAPEVPSDCSDVRR